MIRRLFLKVLRRRKLRAELETELAFHREMTNVNGNHIPFGNTTVIKESALDLWRFNVAENLCRDIVFALRRLRKNPGYAIAAVGSLALGLGITVAMFTLLNAVVFRPLPYSRPQRLVRVTQLLKANSTDEITITPDFLDWRRLNRSFDEMAGINEQIYIATGLSRPIEVHGARASASLLPVLGTKPMLGRNFRREEDLAGGQHVAIITHAFWRSFLGENAEVLGKSLVLDGDTYTIVGVLPPDFIFPSDSDIQIITPLAKNESAELARDGRVLTIIHSVIGRLKPGVSFAQARDDLAAIQAHLPLPAYHPTITIKLLSLRTFLFGNEKLTASVLVTGSLLFLVVASANLGNLSLAQLMQREREFALRRALGAARARVVAQLCVENALIASVACGFSLLLVFAIRLGITMIPTYQSSLYGRLPIDANVLLFTMSALLVVVFLFALIPALRVSDTHTDAAIKAGQGSIAGRRYQLRFLSIVAAAEIAIVMGLSTSAVLMVRSFWNMRYRDLGFQAQHVIAAPLDLAARKYDDPRRELAFLSDLLGRARTLPGVEEAALSVASEIPPGSWHATNNSRIEGRPLPVNSRHKALSRNQVVSAGYFEILGIPLLEGRLLRNTDGPGSSPVVVVSREFERRYFQHGTAIGHRLMTGDAWEGQWYTIIGVVGDVKSSGLKTAPEPVIYMPYMQTTGIFIREPAVIVKSALPVAAIAPMLRHAVSQADPELPVSKLETLNDRINASVARPLFTAILLAGLSALGAVLAILGVYGLVACRVRSQMREIAVRQALGAPPLQIITQIVHSAIAVTSAGLVFGLLFTFCATRLISSLLFQVSPRDPVTLIGVCFVAIAAALAASVVPALQAARSDTLVFLRET